MKKWKEYCDNISSYYEWIEDDELHNLVVISYNILEINYNKQKFWQYCKNELLNDLLMSDSIYLYLIAVEKMKNKNSKVEHYKKCWKKVSDLFPIQMFELGLEVEYKYNGNYYYLGIAKTTLNHLEDLLKILEMKSKKYVTFMSKTDYFQDSSDINKLILKYVLLDVQEDINYHNLFYLCKNNDDIVCRYGVDSIGAEFALIMKKDKVNDYMSKKFISGIKNLSSHGEINKESLKIL